MALVFFICLGIAAMGVFGLIAPDRFIGFIRSRQTTEGMDYFLYFRLYGPTGPFFDKSWQLPDLERLK